MPKDSYATFRKRFPNVKKAKKTGPELEREITAMRIAAEDLVGKTDKFRTSTPTLPSPRRY
jgi:hypothetical protein